MQRISTVLILLISSFVGTYGQVFDYTLKENKFDLLGSFVIWCSSQLHSHATPAEVLDDISELDVSKLWKIDRSATKRNSVGADQWSDATLYVSLASPILLGLVDKKARSKGAQIAMMGLQGFFFESGLNRFAKTMGERPRPYIYRRGEEVLNRAISKNSTKSFYSGHTSSSAYFCFYFAKVHAELHPGSKWNKYVWISAACVPALTGYLRVRAGKHFPSDVITGYLIGGSIGVIVPTIYKSKSVRISAQVNGIGVRFLL